MGRGQVEGAEYPGLIPSPFLTAGSNRAGRISSWYVVFAGAASRRAQMRRSIGLTGDFVEEPAGHGFARFTPFAPCAGERECQQFLGGVMPT